MIRSAFPTIRRASHRVALLVLATLFWGVPVTAETSTSVYDTVRFVDHLNDLPADIAWMQAHDKPMMVFFHASYCGYCRKIDDEFLIPMRLDPDYQGRLIIRRVQVDGGRNFVDVDGDEGRPKALADRLEVRGVPYVLFFAPNGQRVGEITGTAPGFYSYYLDKNVDLAERCARDMSPAECQSFVDAPGLR
ncbi:MAG: thioredoxin family protein [Halothiobacillaceae bacterium]|nr:thioredoxin family protein [Halothiobacillaceae bacterium]